jgi:hypothetical protein
VWWPGLLGPQPTNSQQPSAPSHGRCSVETASSRFGLVPHPSWLFLSGERNLGLHWLARPRPGRSAWQCPLPNAIRGQISLLGFGFYFVQHRCLTPPSRGPAFGRPLTSNVRQCESKAEFMPHLPFPAAQCLGLDALSPWEMRARFSVGLGCPSFGGQRAGRGCPSRVRGKLVTGLTPSLPGKRPVGLRPVPSSAVLARISATHRVPPLVTGPEILNTYTA